VTLPEVLALRPGERIRFYERKFTVLVEARPIFGGKYILSAMEQGQTRRHLFYIGQAGDRPENFRHGWI
jgi:hypothetical protein